MSQKIRIKLKSFDHNRKSYGCCSKWSDSTADAQAYLHGEPLDLR